MSKLYQYNGFEWVEIARNGSDGTNGKDGKDADITLVISELEEWKGKMEKKVKAIPERPTTTVFGPGKTRVFLKDLSSQLNGVLKTFEIGTHYGIIAVHSSSSPFGAFRPIIDYNEVGRNIVFTSQIDPEISLAQGQSLVISYLK